MFHRNLSLNLGKGFLVVLGPRKFFLVPTGLGKLTIERFLLLPQAKHSGEPLGDPNARVIEVFLLVSQSVFKLVLSTQIQNGPLLAPGTGSLRRRQN